MNIFVARIDFNCEFKCLSSVILKLQFFCTASVRKHNSISDQRTRTRISFSETREDVLSCKFCPPPIWNWISEFKGKLTNGSIVCQFTENSTAAIQLCVRQLVSHSPAATKIGLRIPGFPDVTSCSASVAWVHELKVNKTQVSRREASRPSQDRKAEIHRNSQTNCKHCESQWVTQWMP